MARLRGGLAPADLAIAASANLEAGDDKLQEPEVRVLLPQHEAPDLAISSRVDAAVGLAHLRPDHLHLAHRVHAAHRVQRPLPARGRYVLLDYVLGGRSLLRIITMSIQENEEHNGNLD